MTPENNSLLRCMRIYSIYTSLEHVDDHVFISDSKILQLVS